MRVNNFEPRSDLLHPFPRSEIFFLHKGIPLCPFVLVKGINFLMKLERSKSIDCVIMKGSRDFIILLRTTHGCGNLKSKLERRIDFLLIRVYMCIA